MSTTKTLKNAGDNNYMLIRLVVTSVNQPNHTVNELVKAPSVIIVTRPQSVIIFELTYLSIFISIYHFINDLISFFSIYLLF